MTSWRLTFYRWKWPQGLSPWSAARELHQQSPTTKLRGFDASANEIIVKRREKGAPYYAIAAELGRTEATVRRHFCKYLEAHSSRAQLDSKKPWTSRGTARTHKAWTKDDHEFIEKARHEGRSFPDIARALGTSVGCIARQYYVHVAGQRRRGNSRTVHCTGEQKATIEQGLKAGKTITRLNQETGLSMHAVRQIRHKVLGIRQNKGSLSTNELEAIREGRSRGQTYVAIGRSIGRSPATVARGYKKLMYAMSQEPS